ncbi:MAG: FkbM family methyltransferase [Rhodospirillales bacterium]|jgi:FkbM family methyltransferase|nr:FkbM family methyltransferase [Rhodospirillales bacterium]
MKLDFESSAIASDIPRSHRQYLMRRVASALVTIFRLNNGGPFTTELVQMIQPKLTVQTPKGPIYFRGGHGRLRWLAETFFTSEEPQTAEWLDTLEPKDVLWDVGAHVGMVSIYAARFSGARVFSFEPEAQNFALLVQNIVLNELTDRCTPASVAIAGRTGFGFLGISYLTKGGAYNQFSDRDTPASHPKGNTIHQFINGITLDDLVEDGSCLTPSHLKIDVDGLEPDILDGAEKLLKTPTLVSVLVEVNQADERQRKMPALLERHGFKLYKVRSNWEGRSNRAREAEMPTTNMIFNRPHI